MRHALGSLADLGALVRAARVGRRLTQHALAARLGVSVRLLSELELGVRDVRASNLLHVLGRLGFDLEAVPRHPEPEGAHDAEAPARQRVRVAAPSKGRRRGS